MATRLPKLCRVQEVARAKPKERFTSLAHLLTEEALVRSFRGLRAEAAPGVDGETKASYGEHLKANVPALHQRLKEGRYLAQPVLRHWLDKPDGGRRPIGLPALEDKIVQGAVLEILNSIYETDFCGFSYGFRPGRGAHQARGQVYCVRYSDDAVLAFEYEDDAQALRGVLEASLARYGLNLHPQ